MVDSAFNKGHETKEQAPTSDLASMQRYDLDRAMEDVLAPFDQITPSKEGLQLWAFVHKTLQQFSLQRSYSEAYILNTAYLRAVDAINAGKCITSPYGWLRSAAYNYIRECHRAQRRTTEFKEGCTPARIRPNPTYSNSENLSKLKTVLEKLPLLEQKLLNLKIVDGKTWQIIQTELEQEGFGHYQITTLRKKKSRALTKLRRYFKSL